MFPVRYDMRLVKKGNRKLKRKENKAEGKEGRRTREAHANDADEPSQSIRGRTIPARAPDALPEQSPAPRSSPLHWDSRPPAHQHASLPP
jgi:hypothetical protein